MTGFYNVYVGIVVNNIDPENKGRVQVYISSLGPSLICEKNGKGAKYRITGTKYGSLTDQDIKVLKKVLPWSYTLSPVIGGSSIARYNPKEEIATMSKSAATTEEFKFKNLDYGARSYGSRISYYGAFSDPFADPTKNYVRNGNFSGRDYFSKSFVNMPNGVYSVPAVNARVLVAFVNGSKTNGVVLGKVPWDIEFNLIKK